MNKGLTERGLSFLFSIAFFVSTASADEVGFGLDSKSFPKPINHFLSTHCLSCHGPDKQKESSGLMF